MLCAQWCAALFWTLPVDQRSTLDNLVASEVLEWLAAGPVLGIWCGTPSLDSMQRQFFCVIVLCSESLLATTAPSTHFCGSALIVRARRNAGVLYMLISVLAVVDFENALVCCSSTLARHHVVICNVVLPTEFAPSLDYHISIGKNSRQNHQPSLSARMPHCMLSLSRTAYDIV